MLLIAYMYMYVTLQMLVNSYSTWCTRWYRNFKIVCKARAQELLIKSLLDQS